MNNVHIYILSTKENHQLSPSEFETWVHVNDFFWWPHEMSASASFSAFTHGFVHVFHVYTWTILDRHVLRAAYLRRLDPPPHEYPVRELCFWLIFSKRKNSFGLHLDVGGAQGTLSTPYLVTCHFSVRGAQSTIFSVGGAQGTLSTPYLVTCHFSVRGAQSTIFSVGGAQGTLSTPYLVTCHFSVGRTQGILSTPLLDFISNFQKPPMWSSYWLWSLEQPRYIYICYFYCYYHVYTYIYIYTLSVIISETTSDCAIRSWMWTQQPFLNCSQAETKRPRTVMGTLSRSSLAPWILKISVVFKDYPGLISINITGNNLHWIGFENLQESIVRIVLLSRHMGRFL